MRQWCYLFSFWAGYISQISCPVYKFHNYLFKIIFGLPQSVTDFEVILAYMDINGGQNHYNFILLHFMGHSTLYKKTNFPLRIFSLCVTKSASSSGFGHVYWRNP